MARDGERERKYQKYQIIGGSTCYHAGFLLNLFFSTLKMEAICSSETLVDFRLATRRYIPEDKILHNHRCENFKSYILKGLF
jgi:hypothetical protein